MRGLEKPSPPSNVSPDGQAPRGLVDSEGVYLATLPSRKNPVKFARDTFDGLDKAKLRKVMSGEQKSLCVYCERALSESDPSAHVEHWRPRSSAAEYALHWRNLYLSCSTRDTCGVRKDDRPSRPTTQIRTFPGPLNSTTKSWSASAAGARCTSATTCTWTGRPAEPSSWPSTTTARMGADRGGPSSISITRLSWRLAVRRWTANRRGCGGSLSRGRHRVRSGPGEPAVSSAAVSFLRS